SERQECARDAAEDIQDSETPRPQPGLHTRAEDEQGQHVEGYVHPPPVQAPVRDHRPPPPPQQPGHEDEGERNARHRLLKEEDGDVCEQKGAYYRCHQVALRSGFGLVRWNEDSGRDPSRDRSVDLGCGFAPPSQPRSPEAPMIRTAILAAACLAVGACSTRDTNDSPDGAQTSADSPSKG